MAIKEKQKEQKEDPKKNTSIQFDYVSSNL